MSDKDDESQETENEVRDKNAILTDTDREYLKGMKDYGASSKSKRKEAIRERVAEGIMDFELLINELEEEEYEKIFEYIEEERGVDPHKMISHMIAFMYVGWNKWFISPESFIDLEQPMNTAKFLWSMSDGIKHGKSYFNNEVDEVYLAVNQFLFEPPEKRAMAEALSGTEVWREQNISQLERMKMNPKTDIPHDADVEEYTGLGDTPEELASWIISQRMKLYENLAVEYQDPSNWPGVKDRKRVEVDSSSKGFYVDKGSKE